MIFKSHNIQIFYKSLKMEFAFVSSEKAWSCESYACRSDYLNSLAIAVSADWPVRRDATAHQADLRVTSDFTKRTLKFRHFDKMRTKTK